MYLYDVKIKVNKMSSRYPLNLPFDLKQAATQLAKQQGISLNQFFYWSTSEKVSELKTSLDDPLFPLITYRRGGIWHPNTDYQRNWYKS